MIISHKYRFVFIKTLKTAGTSIEIFLSTQCGQSDVVTPIIPHVEPHVPRNVGNYYNHIPAHVIRERLGPEVWDSYFKFCIERNPWDKVISHYWMTKVREAREITLDQYLREGNLPHNAPLYTDRNEPKKILVDKVCYYENLIDDLGSIFSSFGISFSGTLGVNAKSEYKTDRKNYRGIYTEEQAEIVRSEFLSEIVMHDYEY